ncbi:MAG: HigA family addiction module antitoxin [Candidatus Gracilibacteria bacterium]|jgi:HTH-type transcriptional regulator/antitoxin HigA
MTPHTTILVHPGETLAENLEFLKISQKDLAIRTDLSEKHISQIINGSASISPETALRFERVLGIKASFWNNLEKNYQECLARIEQEKLIDAEEQHLNQFPCYNELVSLGFVRKTRVKRERVLALLDFFKVQSLSLVPLSTGVNYRETGKKSTEQNIFCLAAWIRCGQITAERTPVKEFDEKKLRVNLSKFRELTKEPNFEDKLKELCAEIGIVTVLMPKFGKTKINGATFWFRDNPIVQLNEKGKRKDIIWFTFFHELGHILKHGKKDLFIEFEKSLDEREKEADEFAENTLIPKADYESWAKDINFEELSMRGIAQEVTSFAKKVDIGVAVVAGRLAHTGDLHWSKVNGLREHISF